MACALPASSPGRKVVYTHFGEGKYDVTENNIRYLLGLKTGGEPVKAEAPQKPLPDAGNLSRLCPADSFGATSRWRITRKLPTGFPDELAEDEWALNRKWRVDTQKSPRAKRRGTAASTSMRAKCSWCWARPAQAGPRLCPLNGEAVARSRQGCPRRHSDYRTQYPLTN